MIWPSLTWHWRGIGLIAAVSVVVHGSLDLHSVHTDSPLTIFRKLKVVVTLVWCLFVCSLSSMWHDTGPSLTLRTCWPETCFSGSEESGGDIGPVLWHVTLLTSAPGAGRGARLSRLLVTSAGGFQNINFWIWASPLITDDDENRNIHVRPISKNQKWNNTNTLPCFG